jgi:putative MATE family efflux protein
VLIRKDVISLSVPIIAEQTFVMIMGVINAIMAGSLGKEVVSAIGMVDSINNVFISFFSALSIGGTVVVAHYIGQKNLKGANEASSLAIISGVALAALVTILLIFFRTMLIKILFGSAEQQVINNSSIYLNITLLTYPFIALTSVACGVLRGSGDTKTPLKITIIMNILNILLSYILIYGINIGNAHLHIAIPGFGIRGAAFGIAAARTIGAALILYTLLRGSTFIKLKIDRTFKLNFEILRSIFGIGFPASVESLMFNGGKLITQVFIVGMGTASIAANYVAGVVFGLVNIPGAALSIAATTLVGQSIGKNEIEEANSILRYLTKLTSVCLLILCLLVIPFAGVLSAFFTKSSDVIEISSTLIRVSALVMPAIWAISFILPAGLKGAGDAKYTMIVSIFGMWAFRITLGYILGVPLKMGVLGVWIGMYIDWLVRGIFFYIRLQRGKWKKNVVIRKIDEAC